MYSTDDRNGFIEESEFHSIQTPDAKYESINLEKYKPRTMFTKIKNTSAVDKRYDHKIPKEDGPAPGLYNVEDAIKKTQWVTRKLPVDKQRTVGFIEKF